MCSGDQISNNYVTSGNYLIKVICFVYAAKGTWYFGVSEAPKNVHGGGYTHTNLISRRKDLFSRSLGANPKVPRDHAQKGDKGQHSSLILIRTMYILWGLYVLF